MVKSAFLRYVISIMAGLALIPTATTCNADRSDGLNYTAAAASYGILAEKSLDLLSEFDLETWGTMLSDSVVYYFPDLDAGNSKKLTGKIALLGWWKNYIAASGLKSMSIEHASYMPVYIARGVRSGAQVIAYFSNNMVYDSGAVSVKMNFVIHFDENKMIDGYYTYYDRTPIIRILKNKIVRAEFGRMQWTDGAYRGQILNEL